MLHMKFLRTSMYRMFNFSWDASKCFLTFLILVSFSDKIVDPQTNRCLCCVSKVMGKGAHVVELLIQFFYKRLDALGLDNKEVGDKFLERSISFKPVNVMPSSKYLS